MPANPRARRVITLLSAAIATVAMLLVVRAPAQASTTPGAEAAVTNVVSIAMGSLHQWEGECFPFVRRVIAAATGRTIGWDYHLGYLEAGAVEVPLDAVQEGDVIQMADPNNSQGHGAYPGLHTAIVMQNHGGGTLTVIDSNSQWDGVVRIREGYNPALLAARYANITARAYRFPGVSAASTSTTPIDGPVTVGGPAIVRADGQCLRLRSSAGVGGVILNCLPESTVVTVLDGTAVSDGYAWRQVSALGQTGWVAEQYIAAVGTDTVTPAPTPITSSTPPPVPSEPVPAPVDNVLTGPLPVGGGVGLVVWSGGTTSALVAAAQAQGCALSSVWTTYNGGFVGYTVGAPTFVNRSWDVLYPGGMISGTAALVVLCDTSSSAPIVGPGAGAVPSAPVPAPVDNVLTGPLPVGGGVGLVVWSGGTTSALVAAAQAQGCSLSSVWTTYNGGFVGYTVGAPTFVNRSWDVLYPGGMITGMTALVVLCDASGSAPAITAPTIAAPTIAAPVSGTPVGPAGND
ncbi:MAG: hypothetical protein CVU47_09145 [Chloroflexi bacterium HGW-Chloroflexi-9]|nr:MAG: hypothetical protein CVU47_09145 [Chloroflexi bacterium HGW-Chloroflexi-9]